MHYNSADLGRMIDVLASDIIAAFPPAAGPVTIVGIRTRGEVLAERLGHMLEVRGHRDIGRGVLDITLYRDDVSEIGPRPMVRPTHINADINGKPLILVDDVLFTGRTVRAALDALADFGRPSVVKLVVLVDRGGRELPIQPDFVALVQRDVPMSHRVKVKLTERDGNDEIVIDQRLKTGLVDPDL